MNNTISFYPGPSKVYPQVLPFLQEAYLKGILSLNHRSREFTAINIEAITALKQSLYIPDDYGVYFVSSATECWEIIAQSLTAESSTHVFNGAFGKKWFDYAQRLHPECKAVEFGIDELPPTAFGNTSLICLTQNETSNGTALDMNTLKTVRENNGDALIAVDATSSMAGIQLEFELADVWYASVQKCFGLPAGMAVLICSPKAIERAEDIDDNKHYNSLLNIHANGEKWQTTHTPNTLNIYLMSRLLPELPEIEVTNEIIEERASMWYDFIGQLNGIQLLVKESTTRSKTVIAVEADTETLEYIKSEARENNILLGRGYGDWLHKSFRIANFPAISDIEITMLKEFLTSVTKNL